jgi:cation diffusion facilitator family transporter
MEISSNTEQQKKAAAQWSICSNSILIVLKLAVAALTGTVSVFAEAVHSFGDFLGAIVAMVAIRVSDAPPDQSHAYGHGKYENLSGVVTALLMFIAGSFAVADSVKHLFTHEKPTTFAPGLCVMALSAAANTVVSLHLLKVGKETDSPALIAEGKHRRVDILTSSSVFVSLLIVKFTGLTWIDPAAALMVSGMIFVTAYKLAGDAVGTLSDKSLPIEEEKALRDALDSEPRVLSYHNLRTRKSGSHRHVDVHVLISDSNSFVQAHEFTEELQEKLRHALPNVHPIIHIEPYEAEAQHQRKEHGRKV